MNTLIPAEGMMGQAQRWAGHHAHQTDLPPGSWTQSLASLWTLAVHPGAGWDHYIVPGVKER